MIGLLRQRRYSLQQIADTAGVHPGTVWRWVATGVRGKKLSAIRLGGRLYVLEDDLQKFFGTPRAAAFAASEHDNQDQGLWSGGALADRDAMKR